MSVAVVGLLWVVGASVVVAGLVILNTKLVPEEKRVADGDVSGAVFSVVGVLYSIVLAFIVIAVWDSMSGAEKSSYKEANGVLEVYWASGAMPNQKAEIRRLCTDYTETVIKDEWPQMEKRTEIDAKGWDTLDKIRSQVQSFAPKDDAETDMRTRAIEAIKMVTEGRQERIASADAGISPVMWIVLIAGAILNIAFMFLFGVDKLIPHVIIAVALTAMIVLLLFTVYELEYPFSRGVKVDPTAFELIKGRLDKIP